MADNFWDGDAFATVSSAKASRTTNPRRVPTTSQDMDELREASAKAQAERDARLDYNSTARAVTDMKTGPWKAKWLDMITPDEDGGWLDPIGAAIGAPFRAFVDDKTAAARDQLKTVGARVALQGSQQMKGSSSDKDTALMRMAGVSAYKGVGENNRILAAAQRDSIISEARALFKSKWISKMGSMSNPRPDGVTYEQALRETDRRANKIYEDSTRRKLPPPPPKRRGTTTGRTVLDIQGNPVR
jgi:hypothetical protein